MATQRSFRIITRVQDSPSASHCLRHRPPGHVNLGRHGHAQYRRLLSSIRRVRFLPFRKHTPEEAKDQETWKAQKAALQSKFGETGWQPRKRLSPDAMYGIRALHAQNREVYSLPYLAKQFEVSPEAIRRILKSDWQPTPDEALKRYERWERRGQSVWDRWAELGYKPPKKWRENVKDSSSGEEVTDVEPKSKLRKGKAPSSSLLSNRIL